MVALSIWRYRYVCRVLQRLGLHCVCIESVGFDHASHRRTSGDCSSRLRLDTIRILPSDSPQLTPCTSRRLDMIAKLHYSARSGLYRSLRFPVLISVDSVVLCLNRQRSIHKNLDRSSLSLQRISPCLSTFLVHFQRFGYFMPVSICLRALKHSSRTYGALCRGLQGCRYA